LGELIEFGFEADLKWDESPIELVVAQIIGYSAKYTGGVAEVRIEGDGDTGGVLSHKCSKYININT
jgi:hypothetical protein